VDRCVLVSRCRLVSDSGYGGCACGCVLVGRFGLVNRRVAIEPGRGGGGGCGVVVGGGGVVGRVALLSRRVASESCHGCGCGCGGGGCDVGCVLCRVVLVSRGYVVSKCCHGSRGFGGGQCPLLYLVFVSETADQPVLHVKSRCIFKIVKQLNAAKLEL